MKKFLLLFVALAVAACSDPPAPIPKEAADIGVGVEQTSFNLLAASGCPGPSDGIDGTFNNQALEELNRIRTRFLWACATSTSFGATSRARTAEDHASYLHDAHLVANAGCFPSNTHNEISRSPACPHFTGVQPPDRAIAHSQTDWAGEVIIDNTSSSVPFNVATWMSTPYHRLSFLDKRQNIAGYGYTQNVATQQSSAVMDFFGDVTGPRSGFSAVWPPSGSAGWPRAFDGNESPQPPAPPTGWPSGYPISVHYSKLILTDGWLIKKSTGDWVPTTRIYNNTDPNGELLVGEAYMYSNVPLEANTVYQPHFIGTSDGHYIDWWWEFQTGSNMYATDQDI